MQISFLTFHFLSQCLDNPLHPQVQRHQPPQLLVQCQLLALCHLLPPVSPIQIAAWTTLKTTRKSSVVQKRLKLSYLKLRLVGPSFPPMNVMLISCLSTARIHPAADRDIPPATLFRYHTASCPTPFTHREFEDSMIGRGMKAFNSVDGVSPDAWHLLSTCTVLCPGCRMKFSVDGFRAHTVSGHCPKPGARFVVAPSHSMLFVDFIECTYLIELSSPLPPSG
jgi:hypothetical protein